MYISADPAASVEGIFRAFDATGTGVTFCLRTGITAEKKGYAVAEKTVISLPRRRFTREQLSRILVLHWEEWQLPGRHIGLWRNSRNRILIEVTVIIHDFYSALKKAALAGEEFIYELETGRLIRVSDYNLTELLGRQVAPVIGSPNSTTQQGGTVSI